MSLSIICRDLFDNQAIRQPGDDAFSEISSTVRFISSSNSSTRMNVSAAMDPATGMGQVRICSGVVDFVLCMSLMQ